MLPTYPDATHHQVDEEFQPYQEAVGKPAGPSLSNSPSILPVELQLYLLPFLDYQSLRSLSWTSKHFYQLLTDPISEDVIRESLIALETDLDQRHPTLVERGLCPCYRCLRILHVKCCFSYLESTRYELGGDRAQDRRCMSCCYGFLTGSGQPELFVIGGQCWLVCAICRQVERYVASDGASEYAWKILRRCVRCAKVAADRGARKRELCGDLVASQLHLNQAAVMAQETAEAGSIPEGLSEASRTPG